MNPTESDAELVLDARADLAEGPWWDPVRGCLFWIDILKGEVHQFDPSANADRALSVGQPVGATAPRASGGLVLALRDGIGLLDLDAERCEVIVEVEKDNIKNRMNDGKCDPTGRFWAGTMAFDSSEGAGSLYCLERDRQLRRVLENVSVSNGLDWSPDGRTMYYVDTLTQRVDAFDFDPVGGLVTNRRPVIVFSGSCFADGLTVDADGYLWIAVWGSWSVQRYSPAGILDRVVRLPVAQVTSCAFGGEDFRDLYITSAAKDLSSRDRRDQPHAGGIFRVRTGIRGRPAYAFAG